jgi:hypothetical protein
MENQRDDQERGPSSEPEACNSVVRLWFVRHGVHPSLTVAMDDFYHCAYAARFGPKAQGLENSIG